MPATKTWNNPSNNPRPEHDIDGETVDVAESFSNGLDSPDDSPGCVCYIDVDVTPSNSSDDIDETPTAGETDEGSQGAAALQSDSLSASISQTVESVSQSILNDAGSDADLSDQLTSMGDSIKADSSLLSILDDSGQMGSGLSDMSSDELGARFASSRLMSAWNTSSSVDPQSMALQKVVADKFDLDVPDYVMRTADRPVRSEIQNFGIDGSGTRGEVADRLAKSPVLKSFTDNVYKNTQAKLDQLGVKSVTLRRGVNYKAASDPLEGLTKADIASNPISSWTTSQGAAESFAADGTETENGYVITTTYPASDIFSLPATGLGTSGEDEAIVIGNPASAAIEPMP
jgi:hypothetical protein